MCTCRSTTFWESGGLGGRGSGLPGRSLLWPPVSGDQPAGQPGGEGVVHWPLWGTQEKELLHRGEEAAGQDHARVSGRSKKKEKDNMHKKCSELFDISNQFYYVNFMYFLLQFVGIWPLFGHQVCYCETLWRRRSREHDGLLLRAFLPVGPKRSHWHCHRHTPQRPTQPPDRPAEVPTRG